MFLKVKAAKNSIVGYSYQKLVGFYFLALRDVKREFNGLKIEADVDHNFNTDKKRSANEKRK